MSLSSKVTKKITDYSDKKSLGSKLRRKRLEFFLPLIDASFENNGAVKIIDIGGTKEYWNIVDCSYLEEKKIHITLVNLPGSTLPPDEKHFSYVVGNGCDLSMVEDKEYHIAHSNSVIEHVGDWSKMLQFASETERVSESYFVQTPNYWFPIEPHFMAPCFHWLPKPTRVWLVMNYQLGQWNKVDTVSAGVSLVESARLLTKQMLMELFRDADIKTERLIGLPKSYVAIKS